CSHLISLPWYADHRDLLSFPTRRSSDLTFTASPALSCAAADGLGSGVGEAGAGVETVWFIGFVLLFAFELSGPLDSQAVKASDRSVTARIFFVMVILHSMDVSRSGRPPSLLERC